MIACPMMARSEGASSRRDFSTRSEIRYTRWLSDSGAQVIRAGLARQDQASRPPARAGIGEGESRAVEAAQRAVSNPLLEDSSIEGARGVIVNITGGSDLSLTEAAEATAIITKVADPEANKIYGIVTDESMGGAAKVTVIATGFGSLVARKVPPTPVDLANYVGPGAVAPGALPQAEQGGFCRKTPNAKVAVGGGRLDLDVPPSCASRAATTEAPVHRDAGCRRPPV